MVARCVEKEAATTLTVHFCLPPTDTTGVGAFDVFYAAVRGDCRVCFVESENVAKKS